MIDSAFAITFSNEQLTSIAKQLQQAVSLLNKIAAADDKLLEDLEKRIAKLER